MLMALGASRRPFPGSSITAMSLAARLMLYGRLMRLHRPIGTLLLLWPTLWAIWIAAKGQPSWLVVTIFITGTFLIVDGGVLARAI